MNLYTVTTVRGAGSSGAERGGRGVSADGALAAPGARRARAARRAGPPARPLPAAL